MKEAKMNSQIKKINETEDQKYACEIYISTANETTLHFTQHPLGEK